MSEEFLTSMRILMKSLPRWKTFEPSFRLQFSRTSLLVYTRNSFLTSTQLRSSSCYFWETEKSIQRVNRKFRSSNRTRKKTKKSKRNLKPEPRYLVSSQTSKNSTPAAPSPPLVPAAKANQDFNPNQVKLKPSPKKRSARKDVNYKEASGESTSSVEFPVEGKHTASDSGNKTPIFPQQNQFPTFDAPNSSTQTTGAPFAFYTLIPKNKKKNSKHSRSSRSPSLDDLDTKPSSNKEKK